MKNACEASPLGGLTQRRYFALISKEIFMARFPLASLPTLGFHKGSGKRWFGSTRGDGSRLHAACDLIAKPGTPIYSVAPGIVLDKHYFYQNTYALVVHHFFFMVRYGEIGKELAEGISPGSYVSEGEHIANVGKLSSGGSMLHFEMYRGDAGGNLTQKNNKTYNYVEGNKYQRRADLLDPTPYLQEWALTGGTG
jgi:murein DD-endopeptidase MepM/ murein hydrolase activator NlpD